MKAVLYTRRGCHLCEAAEDMLAAWRPALEAECVDVDGDVELARRFGDRVPVLTVEGAVVLEGRFEEADLARLLARSITSPASDPGDRDHPPAARPS